LSQLVLAWGQNGHRIVAQICYNNLTPEARQMVDETLGDNYLAQISTWADYVKSEKGWDFVQPWHYMTVHPEETIPQTRTLLASNDKIDDVYEGIELMQAILKGDEAAAEKFQTMMTENKVQPLAGSLQATALAFLIHFIGDIHQPLHVGKNRDQGGNKIKVLFFSEESNLHRVWDTDIIEKENLSYTEFSAFVEIHTRTIKERCMQDGVETWAAESITLREEIYNTLYDYTDRDTGLPSFSYNYQHDFLPKVEERLGAAGYRAAAMINALLD
jgi:hypothetical protein